jgi:hypothetical protein
VTLPLPVPGLVIRYSYLWHRDYLQGREEGGKDRPCAIVAAIRADDNGATRVLVLPVTHSPPDQQSLAAEIPATVKQRLKLDGERSWVILSEWNDFVWPGSDLRRVAGGNDGPVSYGMLPPGFFSDIRDRFLALARAGTVKAVRRT